MTDRNDPSGSTVSGVNTRFFLIRQARPAPVPAANERREIDDHPTVACPAHGAHREPGAVDQGCQVYVDDPPPGPRIVGEQIAIADASDVRDDVEPAEPLHSRADGRGKVI